jgi:hypothetical protein
MPVWKAALEHTTVYTKKCGILRNLCVLNISKWFCIWQARSDGHTRATLQPDVHGRGRVPAAVLRPRLSDQSAGCWRKVQLPLCVVLSRRVRKVSLQTRGARLQLESTYNARFHSSHTAFNNLLYLDVSKANRTIYTPLTVGKWNLWCTSNSTTVCRLLAHGQSLTCLFLCTIFISFRQSKLKLKRDVFLI